MMDISELLDALKDYLEERESHDNARDATQYDWGYFGHDARERLERAEGRVERALVALIKKAGETNEQQ